MLLSEHLFMGGPCNKPAGWASSEKGCCKSKVKCMFDKLLAGACITNTHIHTNTHTHIHTHTQPHTHIPTTNIKCVIKIHKFVMYSHTQHTDHKLL